ncbi:MAG: hypothetical protein GXY86_10820 [Firmicutes bacterium]|jgi:hypothetical protein|nr:hypothetical protein [Bacillota bacterium]
MKKFFISLFFVFLIILNQQNTQGKEIKFSNNIVDFEINNSTWYVIHQESSEKYFLNKYDNGLKLIKSIPIKDQPFAIETCKNTIILETEGYIVGLNLDLNKLWEIKGNYLIKIKNEILLLINEAGPVTNDCGEIRKIDPEKGVDIWKYVFETGINDYSISEDYKNVLFNTEDKKSYFIKDGKLLQKKNNDYIVNSVIDQEGNIYAIHLNFKTKPQLKKYNSNFEQINLTFLTDGGILGLFKRDNTLLFVEEKTIQLLSMKSLKVIEQKKNFLNLSGFHIEYLLNKFICTETSMDNNNQSKTNVKIYSFEGKSLLNKRYTCRYFSKKVIGDLLYLSHDSVIEKIKL